MKHLRSLTRDHSVQMRGIGLALALLGSLVVCDSALALDTGSPVAMTKPWPAPVGHRQPEARDLPPQVTEDEGAISRSERDLDKKIKSICRGC
jgi:hypothetical protein